MNETPRATHGDVDADGEIVDRARLDRLSSGIGELADGITPASQLHLVRMLLDDRLDLVRALLGRARAVST